MRRTRTLLILSLLPLSPLFQAQGLFAQAVTGPLVVSNNWPECTNLQTWAQDIWRLEGLSQASDTRKAIALFNWVRLFNRVAYGGLISMQEGPAGQETAVLDSHKSLFVYGWGWCDTHSRAIEALWQEYMADPSAGTRVCCLDEKGGYHTMVRLLMDGNYGAFDARFAFYLLDRDNPDARVLDWHEVGKNENVLMNEKFSKRQPIFWEAPEEHLKYVLRIEETYWEKEKDWEEAGKPIYNMFASPMHQMGVRFHDMNWRLPRGSIIERHWNNQARKFVRPVKKTNEHDNDFLPSGRFSWLSEAKHEGDYKKARPKL